MNKEWKGNKKSVSTMLGMSTTWNPEQRAAGDYYTTDPTAVEQFVKHISKNYGLITGSLEQDLERIYTLREMGYWAYIMIYNKEHADPIYKDLSRWVNNRRIFARCKRFEDYKK